MDSSYSYYYDDNGNEIWQDDQYDGYKFIGKCPREHLTLGPCLIVGDHAADNTALESISLEVQMKDTGEWKKVSIADIKSEYGLYVDCEELEKAEIPDFKEFRLPETLFYGSRFTNFYIPSNWLPEEILPLLKCANYSGWLAHVEVSPQNPHMTSICGIVYSKDLRELLLLPRRMSDYDYHDFYLPPMVKNVDEYAFEDVPIYKLFISPDTVLPIRAYWVYQLIVMDKNGKQEEVGENGERIPIEKKNTIVIDTVVYSNDMSELLHYEDPFCDLWCYSQEFYVPPTVKRLAKETFRDSTKLRKIYVSPETEIPEDGLKTAYDDDLEIIIIDDKGNKTKWKR